MSVPAIKIRTTFIHALIVTRIEIVIYNTTVTESLAMTILKH